MATQLPPDVGGPFSHIADAHQIAPEAIDALIRQLPVGVVIVDRDGRAVYTNDAARTLPIEKLDPLQWAITRARLTEDVVREDEMQIAPLGEPRRWLSACVTPLRRPGEGVTAAFVVLSDVTARTRMTAWKPVIETLVNL